jgi:plastocyanin
MIRRALFVVGIFVVIGSVGCGGKTSAGPTTPTSTSPSAVTVTIQPSARTLATAAFVPNPITVAPGGTITWSNTDTTTHDMIADSGAWDSGRIAAGGRFDMTFPTRGTIPYHCSIHAGMVGTVVVQ